MSVDGGNFFEKIYKQDLIPFSAPLFADGYHYEYGVWAVLTHQHRPDDARMLCIGKSG